MSDGEPRLYGKNPVKSYLWMSLGYPFGGLHSKGQLSSDDVKYVEKLIREFFHLDPTGLITDTTRIEWYLQGGVSEKQRETFQNQLAERMGLEMAGNFRWDGVVVSTGTTMALGHRIQW